eukprot:3600835-Pleurochrysis_carterae.AAC.1
MGAGASATSLVDADVAAALHVVACVAASLYGSPGTAWRGMLQRVGLRVRLCEARVQLGVRCLSV